MTIHILASGQSNMCGRGTGGPLSSSCSGLVGVWNNANEAGANGSAWVDPMLSSAPFDANGGNNLALWFADRVALITGDDVRLVLVCRGGSALSLWGAGGLMRDEIDAVYALTGAPPADIFLWQQGEAVADQNGTVEAYKTGFESLVLHLRNTGRFAANGLVVAGGNSRSVANTALSELAAERSDMVFSGLRNYDTTDGTHFTGMSLARFGSDMAGAWAAAKNEWQALDPNRVVAAERYPTLCHAGGAVSGWQRRNLNFLECEGWPLTLANGGLRLPANTYAIRAEAQGYKTGRTQIRLIDGSGKVLAVGTCGYAAGGDGVQTVSTIDTIVSIPYTSIVFLEQYVSLDAPLNGLGVAARSGVDECFARLVVEVPS